MLQLVKVLLVLTLVLNCFSLNEARRLSTKLSQVKLVANRANTTTAKPVVYVDSNVYTVLRVSDGDTITIRNDTDNTTSRVRFLYVFVCKFGQILFYF